MGSRKAIAGGELYVIRWQDINKTVQSMPNLKSIWSKNGHVFDCAGRESKYKKVITTFLYENDLIKKLIRFQHRRFPVPLRAFQFFYSYRIIRHIFGFYGSHIHRYYYIGRKNNKTYWLSKNSLYWHFWNQTIIDADILDDIPEVKKYFKNAVAVELGFGIGKNYHKLKFQGFKKYIGVEPNKYIRDLLFQNTEEKLLLKTETAEDFINKKYPFDVLLSFGGVFMCLKKETVDKLFENARKRGVKCIIIVNEGTWKQDIIREDDTIMFNFKERILKAGFENAVFIEKEKDNNIYKYFVMCA